ncbi:hypothetical protein GMOD_00006484 [Pyrenophora seminiperda CCB06]|uniref:Uncharacterized protein n=1 Tax=Pyrenophora seminiperda CCB06 TaxID=1302712 RepID=A0A3M7M5B3_9PLEO|nr:hypothetical protein GMOD_00006484 [Pyrenophora seminiperda CCB06]
MLLFFAGASIIDITTERESPRSDFNRPLFMKGINFSANIAQWNTTVLPYIRQLTFRIASTVDVYWFDAMIRSRALPGLMNNVTKLDLTGFHWFSGISPNRSVNPYLASASQLSSLREVSFTLHAASITTSLWSERQAIELEITDPVRSQARRVLTLRTVLVKYGLDAFFNCTKLEHISLMYINSDIVTANIQFKDPEKLIEAIEKWLASGFKKRQQQVLVTSSQAT